MSGYIGPIPVPQGIQEKQSFTATSGQTTFNTNGYTDGAFINVHLNGVRLVNGTDYTSTNGSDVVLASGANAGDVLDFETFNSFSLVDQTFDNVTLKNPTHEDTDGGRESAVSFKGEQSGGEISTLAQIQASHDGTSDDQKGELIFKTNDGNDGSSPSEVMRIDSLGNVGIGTDTIDVSTQAGGSGYQALQIESDEGGQLNFDHNDAGTGSTLGQINFQRAGEVLAEIEGVTDGATDNGRLAFRVQPDGGALTEAMRIDHDGNIGVGITTPSSMLHLFDGGTDTGITIQSAASANATSSITMMSRKSDNSNMNAVIQNDAGAFTFDTNSTERLRITSGGDLRVGINSDMGGVINASHADGVAIGSANDQTYYRRIYGTAGANLELRFWNGSNEGSLNSSGAWVNASDVSLKENIADIEYGIDTVKSLKPRKYTMKEGGNSEVGFIAQEMESVVPEVVNTSENPNKDEIKGISYGQLTAVLTKALQEAIDKIETLETRLTALEAE
jgi:hypothetical protein